MFAIFKSEENEEGVDGSESGQRKRREVGEKKKGTTANENKEGEGTRMAWEQGIGGAGEEEE